ncbi:unnamed protein product [Closterium sp. Naga37s-1]|nr:unnamed protein product [Closterium sp. Naga37s-1]
MRSYVKVGLSELPFICLFVVLKPVVLDLEGPVDQLSIIHVAGTKGKGSTCAMAESMLRASGHTTGLFTSPHLVDVRERFRLNGEMVSVGTFLQHFWWCYDRCKAAASSPSSPIPMPAYFRFLTLLALRIFTHTQVDVAILEVGVGGRYDGTNIVKCPAVCGVSSLGFDHMEVLGNTLALIADQKAGIFKAGVPAVTAPQEEEAMEVLRQRAAELQIPLEVARPWHEVAPGVRVGLAGKHQEINASLAVSLCRQWAIGSGRTEEARAIDEALASKTLPPAYITGLGSVSWLGRCEILQDCTTAPGQDGGAGGQLTFFLDGAHTVESMEVCGEWFCDATQSGTGCAGADERADEGADEGAEELTAAGVQESSQVEGKTPVRVLLFNCMTKRDPRTLVAQLLDTLERRGLTIQVALFAPSLSSYSTLLPPPSTSSPSHLTSRERSLGAASLGAASRAASLGGASLGGASLGGASLGGASLGGASLGGASLGGASLGGASLGGASLGGASLGGASLGGASLGGASLGGASLGGASLGGASLGGASLGGASLGGASLGGASLGGASLGGASLGGASLGGASLGGASLGAEEAKMIAEGPDSFTGTFPVPSAREKLQLK